MAAASASDFAALAEGRLVVLYGPGGPGGVLSADEAEALALELLGAARSARGWCRDHLGSGRGGGLRTSEGGEVSTRRA